jgi:hypothetical protein
MTGKRKTLLLATDVKEMALNAYVKRVDTAFLSNLVQQRGQ